MEKDDDEDEVPKKKSKSSSSDSDRKGSDGDRLPALMKELLNSVKEKSEESEAMPSYYSAHLYKILQ